MGAADRENIPEYIPGNIGCYDQHPGCYLNGDCGFAGFLAVCASDFFISRLICPDFPVRRVVHHANRR